MPFQSRADDPPAVAPAAPVAPVTPPPAVPAPVAPPAQPAKEPEFDILNATLALMKAEVGLDDPPTITPAPEPVVPAVVVPVPPAGVAPEVPAAAVKKPAKIGLRSPAKGHPLLSDPVPVMPVPAAPPVPVTPVTDAALTDDQLEEIEEARVLEVLFPNRKGYANQVQEYYRTFDQRAQALRAANPNLDEDDPGYQQLLKSKPVMTAMESKKVNRKIGEEQAARAVEEKMAPRLANVEREALRSKIEPKVNEFADKVFPQMMMQLGKQGGDASPVAGIIKLLEDPAKGVNAALEEFPIEMQIIREVSGDAKTMIKEFMMVRNGAAVPDSTNPVHQQIETMITRESELFQQQGKDQLVKDGRSFVPRSQFISYVNNLARHNRNDPDFAQYDQGKWRTGKYWTFDDAFVTDIIAARADQSIKFRINQERERLQKAGYARTPKAPVSVLKPEPTPITPPRTAPSIAPGGAMAPMPSAVKDESPIPISSMTAHLKTSARGGRMQS